MSNTMKLFGLLIIILSLFQFNKSDFLTLRPCQLSNNDDVYKCPLITEPLVNKTVHEYEELILSCDFLGQPEPEIHWLHNGSPLVQSGNRHEFLGNKKIIRIKETFLNDSGEYTCLVKNEYGAVATTSHISVQLSKKPTFKLLPISQKIERGKNVVINCVVAGRPRPKMHWEYRNKHSNTIVKHYEIPSGRFGHFHYNRIYDDGRIIVEATRLIILNSDLTDSGIYRCVAESPQITAERLVAEALVEIIEDITSNREEASINGIIHEEKSKVRARIERRKQIKKYQVRTLFSPREMMKNVFSPSEQSMKSDARRTIFENVIDRIQNKKLQTDTPGLHSAPVFTKKQLVHILDTTECKMDKIPECNASSLYPNHDGTCNNLQHPLWGSSGQPFVRLLTPDYEDGFSQPIGFNPNATYYGFKKPSARTISVKLLGRYTKRRSNHRSDLFTHFSQMLSHDTDFKADSSMEVGAKSGIPCDKSCENDLPCFPIQVTMNASLSITKGNEICFPFTRAAAKCQELPRYVEKADKMTPPAREQLNAVTSFVDVSTLYGFDDDINAKLFDKRSGQHKIGLIGEDGLTYLPFKNETKSCSYANKKPFPCFLGGDIRVNDHTMLMTIHTLLMRAHNHIARNLAELNPQWLLQDGKLYQETRKIIRAMVQHIVYTELLPITLGPVGMLILDEYKGYDKSINPGVASEAAHGAGKIGHYQGNSLIYRLDEENHSIGHMPVSMSMFNTYSFFFDGGDSPLIRGAFRSKGKELSSTQPLTVDFIDRAFITVNKRNDMASIDIQRSRELGHQNYNSYRQACGLDWADSFEELKEEIVHEDVRSIMKDLYGHPGNIDFYVGMGLEQKIDGGSMGPTARCIMAEAFKRSRDGDRFFYKNNQFKTEQLKTIEESTFAKLICLGNKNIKTIQEKVFLQPYLSKQMKCSNLKQLNLLPWKEKIN